MAILYALIGGMFVVYVAVAVVFYLDNRGERAARDAWQSSVLTRIGALEGAVFPPPPDGAPPVRGGPPPGGAPPLARSGVEVAPAAPPPVSFPPAPGGLPLRPVTLTRDDDPAHTRATVVAPAPAEDAARGQTSKSIAPDDARAAVHTSNRPPPPVEVVLDAPPSTVPSRSRTVRSGDETEARALDRLAVMDAELGPEGKAEVRARIEAAEDEREKARARGELGQLPRMDEDDGRETFDDATKVMDIGAARDAVAKATGAASAPPPHRRPVPLQSTRPTMVGGMGEAPPAERAQRVREAWGVDDPMTPTDPSAPSLDARIERLWHLKVAAAIEAGKDARHCHGERCFHETESVSACECHCDGCAMVTDLLIDATREVRGR